MRNFLLKQGYLIIILSFFALQSKGQTASPLKVMTWNIRLDVASDGPNRWELRKNGLCKEIASQHPDVLGVQEALFHQMKDMKHRLKGYSYIGAGRDDGKKKGEFSALFYHKKAVKVLRSGTFWLSETPDIAGSRGWDAACNRVATWGEFEIRKSGKHFFAMNTHFDHMGDTARIQSALLILQKLAELSHKLPVIVTGDFNAGPKSTVYRILTFSENEYTLSDSRKRSGAKINGPDFTFTGFDPAVAPTEIIDYIFVSWDVKVISNSIPVFSTENPYLSDHLPVIAEIEIQ